MKKMIIINILVLAYVLFTLHVDKAVLPQKTIVLVDKQADAKAIAKHVVSYNIIKEGNKRFATGFYVNYNGGTYILTNKHVCDLNKTTYGHDYIQFEDYVGRVIAIDTKHDLCLVTSNRTEGLEMAYSAPNPLDELVLIGFPRGLGKTIRRGHHVDTTELYANWIGEGLFPADNVSVTAYGGNSGSPVCNTSGRVTGVLFAGSPSFHTEALVIPLNHIKEFLDKHTDVMYFMR